MEKLFSNKDVQGMNLTQKMYSENYGQDLEYIKHPINMTNTEHKFAEFTDPPKLGQHTEEILSKFYENNMNIVELGYSRNKIDELRKNKII